MGLSVAPGATIPASALLSTSVTNQPTCLSLGLPISFLRRPGSLSTIAGLGSIQNTATIDQLLASSEEERLQLLHNLAQRPDQYAGTSLLEASANAGQDHSIAEVVDKLIKEQAAMRR